MGSNGNWTTTTGNYGANITGLPLNYIANPAIIVMNGTSDYMNGTATGNTTPAILQADLSMCNNLTINGTTFQPGNVCWTLDVDAANLTGNVSFTTVANLTGNTAGYGNIVAVYGTNPGRVRFHLDYDEGSGTKIPLERVLNLPSAGGNATVGSPWAMLEANVGALQTIKCRVQRLFYFVGEGNWASITPNVTQIDNVVGVANVFLRQAGIQLIWDTNNDNSPDPNTTISDFAGGVSQDPGVYHGEAIFEDDVTTDNSTIAPSYGNPANGYKIGNATTGIDPCLKFLCNNSRPGILQIGMVGSYGLNNEYEGTTFYSQNSTSRTIGANISQSSYTYIVSDNDLGNLSDNHTLNVFTDTGSTDTGLLNSNNITSGNFGNTETASDVYGSLLFISQLGSDPILDGSVLAHEVGRILNLKTRVGNNPAGQLTDGLETQPASFPGKYLGPPGSNLMDENTGNETFLIEDLDLHQAIIMRGGAIFN